MSKPAPNREFVFLLFDVARMVRTQADQRVRGLGMTRAQWAVLSRLERFEGSKQSELAESLEIQPITLTRLVDRLCASGLVERRPDPDDRRAKRLFLTEAAGPVVERLGLLGAELMAEVLAGIDATKIAFMREQLQQMKDNLHAVGNGAPASGNAAAA
jgi:MarR family transcriptional regulator for hemolysin